MQALAVTGPMSDDEIASLPLPERYIISRAHALATEVCTLAAHFSDLTRPPPSLIPRLNNKRKKKTKWSITKRRILRCMWRRSMAGRTL